MAVTDLVLSDETERQCVSAELLVKDLHCAAQSLVKDLEALERFGVYAAETPSADSATLVLLIVAQAALTLDAMVKQSERAERLFAQIRGAC